MNRFFRAPTTVFAVIRETLRNDLEQPNGNAIQPFEPEGDFTVEGVTYQSLAPHHTTGFFAPYVAQFLSLEGVEEIDAEEYQAARPEVEEAE